MELIQNADDAGASEVSLMLDMQSYPTNSLFGKLCLFGKVLWLPKVKNMSSS